MSSAPSAWRFAFHVPFVIAAHRKALSAMFPGSSVVEQPAVNRLVAGSNPARGAKYFKQLAQDFGIEELSKTVHGNVYGNKRQI
jgi:hypothetical protein